MKAAVNKITEQAKRRDTLGRNLVSVLVDQGHAGLMLFNEQQQISSDNVEKITNVILTDPNTRDVWLLKYRIMKVKVGSTDILKSTNDKDTLSDSSLTEDNSEEGGEIDD